MQQQAALFVRLFLFVAVIYLFFRLSSHIAFFTMKSGVWVPINVRGFDVQSHNYYGRTVQVNMSALKLMGENDLKEQGIPMGAIKKIILAPLPCSKRQR